MTELRELGWMDHAACRNIAGFTELEVWRQLEVCWARCMVRLQCADYGARVAADAGSAFVLARTVYGGMPPANVKAWAKATSAVPVSAQFGYGRGHRWAQGDDQVALSMIGNGRTYEEVGDVLGRTAGAVEQRVKRLRTGVAA